MFALEESRGDLTGCVSRLAFLGVALSPRSSSRHCALPVAVVVVALAPGQRLRSGGFRMGLLALLRAAPSALLETASVEDYLGY